MLGAHFKILVIATNEVMIEAGELSALFWL